MREMTAREYLRQMVSEEAARIAAKDGVRLVNERPRPQLVRDNVVRFEERE